ncbi:MAG: CHASE2 domain-containing protein [Leptolyngbyaceae cyanobacterium CSU_1_3]|nr:CHASE2 domain-containing protein [Leptolyngbyaceae cyanobacterium CSU_1_3]
MIRDRVVVVGSIAESVSDRFYTPFSTDTQSTWSGVELHANIANQLIGAAIDGRTLLKGIPEPLELGWVLLWSAVGAALGAQLNSARWTAWVSLGAALCLTGLAYGCFLLGWWVLAVAPMLALLGSALLSRGAMLWSDLRLSHQVLEGYSKTLEVKVRQRTQELRDKNTALEQAKQQAEAASRAKSTFLANMNHELRTPLAIILGCSEILGYDQSLSARQRERLSTIDDSVQHLLKLINDVLEVSKIEAGVVWVDRKTVDLSKLLKSLEEMFRSQAALKGVALWFELAPNLPEHIQTDENKLRQILINLLSNAVKFTEQGHVILRVRVAEPRSLPTSTIVPCQSLHFEVEDTGYGIAPDELDTLFDAFVQAEAGRTSKQGGTGLGLSISQQFVKLLGGEIRVHSAAGQGSLFGFEIEI